MTRLTRPGADFGAIALPLTSFAFEPWTVGAGRLVPPLPATAGRLRIASAVRQASARVADNPRHPIRDGYEHDASALLRGPTGLAAGLAPKKWRDGRVRPTRPRGGPAAPSLWFPRSAAAGPRR